MSFPKFMFAADPRALDDLREAPTDIRDLSLLALQDLVHGEQRGQRLDERWGQDLSDCRKLYVDAKVDWRIVYQERPAPAGSLHKREIFLIAMRPRAGFEAYNTAFHRLGRTRTTTPRAEAARARSPRNVPLRAKAASSAPTPARTPAGTTPHAQKGSSR
ncbi:hypothetical protein GCM10010218_05410 [Streptomyces mashuensis]|uniref:Uncharacterized protein n=2 Tax=Streptomyces mashuensis TaxID=33904 RepID=A0A919AWU9_9ACTN|nr:hypothetical protein GCM10010218_05410 [Streptomyces mashuensis]